MKPLHMNMGKVEGIFLILRDDNLEISKT